MEKKRMNEIVSFLCCWIVFYKFIEIVPFPCRLQRFIALKRFRRDLQFDLYAEKKHDKLTSHHFDTKSSDQSAISQAIIQYADYSFILNNQMI